MLSDELLTRLKDSDTTVETIKKFWEKAHDQQKLEDLEAKTKDENFWLNPRHGLVLKQIQNMRQIIDQYKSLTQAHTEFYELINLFADNEQELKSLEIAVSEHCRALKKFKISLLLSDEQDNENCFVSINSGAGGTESQDWAEMLLRMYVRFCEQEKLTATILDMQRGEGAGIKSAALYIKGKYAYGLLKSEHGIHRLVRISPFDANKRRHTSFAGASVTPEVPDAVIEIDPKDLRIDTFRAGGAGGQHVNKTESAIRITHIPSGIVVQCQNERSQIQNKETALKMLKARLIQKSEEEKRAAAAAVERKSIEWGSQIRSYVLHPYKMVKDHRTDVESGQPEKVLDGDLMEFIEGYLVQSAQK